MNNTLLVQALKHHQRRNALAMIAGVALLIAAMALAGSLGAQKFGMATSLRALFAPLLPAAWLSDIPAWQISLLQQLRLPRIVMAVVAGAGLALAGVAMQGITRNPLVSPYTVGISPAAAFGASLAILSGATGVAGAWSGLYLTVAAAFASAVLCATLVLAFSALRGVSATMLVLGGVGLTYLFSALTASVQFVATEQQLAAIVQWTFGSLNGSTWNEVAVAGGVLLLGAPLLQWHAWALNAFAAGGDDIAASLGFAVGRVRTVVTVVAVMITAAVVSFTGVIGFVGLVAPHIARLLIGGDHRWLLPFSAIVGALLVLLSDMAGRLLFAPVIIPVGIVVAYVGVPLFLHLLLSSRHKAGL
ncbi:MULTISPECIES: iron ABC transporter permease [unclassified Herbaspirillum]|uniref:FecCD family ABC transporter permease n=1 Tax=unclassified Herbaspirillum TaxID=2624150 RepID=UPI000E2E87A1|nr:MULTISPECIES: iron ABC transporter permease [unclassified Herbaspirillum]RFB68019.1 iron ABC transporter permease [Herbaspirillum sp. 3R-3a1]TFI06462.1 iron ABC transporter permease [Herbaspirillum sp. 3R11]TFI13926.1 iron ABC transporter permease [Herbaspirillum sp. 3R-11]TFI24887.1 iron ABC transporter permease [Herbaspirillum sp. 3C11]